MEGPAGQSRRCALCRAPAGRSGAERVAGGTPGRSEQGPAPSAGPGRCLGSRRHSSHMRGQKQDGPVRGPYIHNVAPGAGHLCRAAPAETSHRQAQNQAETERAPGKRLRDHPAGQLRSCAPCGEGEPGTGRQPPPAPGSAKEGLAEPRLFRDSEHPGQHWSEKRGVSGTEGTSSYCARPHPRRSRPCPGAALPAHQAAAAGSGVDPRAPGAEKG